MVSDQGITDFITDTQNTTEKVEEKNKRTNTDLGQLHCAALRAFADCRGRVTCVKLLQSHYQCWHFLALVNSASVDQQVLAVTFLTSVDSLLCLKPTGLFCLSLSTDSLCFLSDLPSLLHLWSRGRSRLQALCVGFALKQTKKSWSQHKRKRIATHRVTYCCLTLSNDFIQL